jgi:hypothetical protein
VNGEGGEVLLLLFGHPVLLRFRNGLRCGGNGLKQDRTQAGKCKSPNPLSDPGRLVS